MYLRKGILERLSLFEEDIKLFVKFSLKILLETQHAVLY